MRVRLLINPPVGSKFDAKKGKEYEVFEKRYTHFYDMTFTYALKDERGEIFCILPRECEVIEESEI